MELTLEQQKAVNKLKRMKVYQIMVRDTYNPKEGWKSYFDYLWYYVRHELDLFEEGHCNDLTKKQAQTTQKWLNEYRNITINFAYPISKK